MKPKLHNLAEEVFGAGWQTKLARHINTNPRTVRRWASEEIEVPEVVILYLEKLRWRWDGFTAEEITGFEKCLREQKLDAAGHKLLAELREHRKRYNR